MAHARLPTRTQLEEKEGDVQHSQGASSDESWARPPPGGPHLAEKTSMDIDIAATPMQPPHRHSARDFSMEDLEVARALTGLRGVSPAEKLVVGPEYSTYQSPASASSSQSEPLLSLLTSQHPFIGHAISAYNVGKAYSGPLRSSVDYVERNIASPVANTVGAAGRISGVENGVRWWLERRRSNSDSNGAAQMSPISPSHNSHKRRREDSESDVERGLPVQRSRAPSDISMAQGEYLPAYDPSRSPTYCSSDPHPTPSKTNRRRNDSSTDPHQPTNNWQTRLILSTSGLGVAMSGESRRSLKYCLSWLRWANGRLGRTLYALQSTLSEYEAAQRQAMERSNGTAHPDHYSLPNRPRDLQAMSAQLTSLKAECVKTLQSAMDVVSKYAGGALPENARLLVRKHLTSLPQRFAFMASLQEKEEEILRRNAEARRHAVECGSASGNQTRSPGDLEAGRVTPSNGSANGESARNEQENVVFGARRVVVLAREGLDMMSQVSAVVDGTITSAEQWCEKLGRKLSDDETQQHQNGEQHGGRSATVTPASQQLSHVPSQAERDSGPDTPMGDSQGVS